VRDSDAAQQRDNAAVARLLLLLLARGGAEQTGGQDEAARVKVLVFRKQGSVFVVAQFDSENGCHEGFAAIGCGLLRVHLTEVLVVARELVQEPFLRLALVWEYTNGAEGRLLRGNGFDGSVVLWW